MFKGFQRTRNPEGGELLESYKNLMSFFFVLLFWVKLILCFIQLRMLKHIYKEKFV